MGTAVDIGRVASQLTSTISRSETTGRNMKIVPITSRADLPAEFDPEIDLGLPDRLVCLWGGTGGDYRGMPAELRREMTDSEIGAVRRRIAAIKHALEPAPQDSTRMLTAAVTAMLGGFPQMQRHDKQAAAMIAASYLWIVRDLPHWAITEACERIRANKAGLNASFCPTEPEFRKVADLCAAVYRRRLAEAEALLRAKVRDEPKPKMSAAELEAKLGRPISDRPQAAVPPVIEPSKGHGARVAAVLGLKPIIESPAVRAFRERTAGKK